MTAARILRAVARGIEVFRSAFFYGGNSRERKTIGGFLGVGQGGAGLVARWRRGAAAMGARR